jgi:hypothetical protein
VVAGGLNGTEISESEVYNTVNGTWTVTGSLNDARWGAAAVRLQSGKVLVAGGQNGLAVLRTAELYDPTAGQWARTGGMTSPRVDFALALLPNGKVLAAGGRSGLGAAGLLATAEIFDPVTGNWTPTGSLLTSREGATATLLPNGKVLLAGGDQINGGILASAELYDPASGQWTAAGTMRNPRTDYSAVLLANGKVLVAGGGGPDDLPTNAELYDPATGTWKPTLPLITGRRGHSAFRLATGKVVLVGGFNFDDEDASGTSEIFDPASAVARASVLTQASKRSQGFHFEFNNTPGLAFSVISAASAAAPLATWTPVGTATEVLPGDYEFTDATSTNAPQRFYRVRSP